MLLLDDIADLVLSIDDVCSVDVGRLSNPAKFRKFAAGLRLDESFTQNDRWLQLEPARSPGYAFGTIMHEMLPVVYDAAWLDKQGGQMGIRITGVGDYSIMTLAHRVIVLGGLPIDLETDAEQLDFEIEPTVMLGYFRRLLLEADNSILGEEDEDEDREITPGELAMNGMPGGAHLASRPMLRAAATGTLSLTSSSVQALNPDSEVNEPIEQESELPPTIDGGMFAEEDEHGGHEETTHVLAPAPVSMPEPIPSPPEKGSSFADTLRQFQSGKVPAPGLGHDTFAAPTLPAAPQTVSKDALASIETKFIAEKSEQRSSWGRGGPDSSEGAGEHFENVDAVWEAQKSPESGSYDPNARSAYGSQVKNTYEELLASYLDGGKKSAEPPQEVRVRRPDTEKGFRHAYPEQTLSFGKDPTPPNRFAGFQTGQSFERRISQLPIEERAVPETRQPRAKHSTGFATSYEKPNIAGGLNMPSAVTQQITKPQSYRTELAYT
ncbi:MAG: hypothetical protein KF874_09665, partial [Rhizobiaceae bacterium]|nr:hypothetical protein [Rhizobiaceae bacterium]